MKPLHGKTVSLPYEEALARTEAALTAEGFGILCRIDVRQKLEEKLGIEMQPYQILGACLPPMAHKAITVEPEIGIMLPCNVVVRATDDGTRIEVVNTEAMVQMFPEADLREVADQVGRSLDKVLASI
jgi:uncharacterized protein (DUF302 family)